MLREGDVTDSGNVAEVFVSYQGEGLLVGRRQVFVRLAGCTVGCRYCDTGWAFAVPRSVVLPDGEHGRVGNPASVDSIVNLVDSADGSGNLSVSLTGGEPLEQPRFAEALVEALAPRDVLLETSGLQLDPLRAIVPKVRWVACDIKLPSATGLGDVLERHEAVLASGVMRGSATFYKIIVDGDTSLGDVETAADLLAAHHGDAPVFLQPVTPMGGSPALPPPHRDRLVDALLLRGLDARLVPQVHTMLGVR
jgi:7-carboxy-7-deazaguanine synthase